MNDPVPPVPLDDLLAHRAWVRDVALALTRDPHAAADAEQQTWLAAVTSPPRTGASPRGWLLTVLRNAVRKGVRGTARRRVHEASAPVRADVPSADETVARAEIHGRVVLAVLALDEPFRTTVLLRYFDGLTPNEVADRQHVAVATVRTRLHRAMQVLRQRLDADGDGRPALVLLVGTGTGAAPSVPRPSGALSSVPTPGTVPGAGGALVTTGAVVMGAFAKTAAVGVAVVVLVAAGWAMWPKGDAGSRPVAAVAPSDASGTDRATATRPRAVAPSTDAALPADDVATAPAASTVRVKVRRADGGDVTGARVVALQGDAAETSAPAAADGVVRVAPAVAARTAVVVVEGAPPVLAEIPAGTGDVDVVVPEGAAIEGAVLLDGAVPRAPLVLTVACNEDWLPEGRLPAALIDAVRRLGFDGDGFPVRTGEGGRFRAGGLPGGRLCWVAGPYGTFVRGQARQVSAIESRAPARGFVLDLVSLPRITGRAVREGGTPIPAANCRLAYDLPVAGAQGTSGVRAGDDGRFEIALEPESVRNLTLRVSDAEDRGARTLDLPSAGDPSRDVGDVAIADVRGVAILVEDPDGRPVPAAVAMYEAAAGESDEILAFAAPSGADGTTVAHVWDGRRAFRVAAPGFAVRRAEIPAGAAEPVRIGLTRATGVVASIEVEAASPSVRLFLHLHAGAPLLDGPGGAMDPIYACVGGVGPFAQATGEAMTLAWFGIGAGRAASVPGLLPGVPFDAEVWDEAGTFHGRQSVELARGEMRALRFRIAAPPRTISGVVLNADGTPAPNVELVVADASGPGPGSFSRGVFEESAADGRFTIDGLCASRLRIRAFAEGRGNRLLRDVPLPPEGLRDLRITLAPDRKIRVRVVGDDGAVIPDAEVVLVPDAADARWFEDSPWSGEEIEPGVHAFSGVPAGVLRFAVKAGARERVAEAAADAVEVRAVVGE